MKSIRSRWLDMIAIVFFIAIVGLFFQQTILKGKLPVPSDSLVGLYHPWRDLYNKDYPRGIPFKNFLITDPVRQQIPWRKIAIDQWKEGKIPLWNPYNLSGTSLLANIQTAALYPINALFFIFSFIDAWTILIILQPLLGGLFMYWYLRSLTLRPIAGLLGALAWSFSGFNIAWLTWGTIGHVALWLPLALLAVDKFVKGRFPELKQPQFRESLIKLAWPLVFIATMIFQFFAGHAQVSLYFILVVIAYGTMRIFQGKERKKAFLLFALFVSISVLLAAAQWMPLLDWIGQSSRVIDGADWHKEGWFIPWAHLVQFIAPDFFGNPTTLNYWGQWNYGEFIGYIGIVPLIFAVHAIFSKQIKMRFFWTGIFISALLFAFPTPIAYLPFVLKIPILSSLQPTRLLFMIDFALAMLAAYGCHEFLDKSKKQRWIFGVALIAAVLTILWGIVATSRFGLLSPLLRGSLEVSMRNLVLPTVLFFVASALLVLYWTTSNVPMPAHRLGGFRNIVTWSIIMLVVVDLLRFGWKFTPFTPKEYFFPETRVILFLKAVPRPFRIMSLDKRILPPNTASFFGIESTDGYDPIISSRYEELMAAIGRGEPNITPPFGFNRIVSLESINSPLIPILGARYILSLAPLQEPYLMKVFEEGETKVYEDARAVPRAYIVERPIVVFGKEKTINALYSIKDFRREAVVEGDVSLLSIPMRGDESVSIARYESNRLDIDVRVSVPRLLVVANSFHSGWKATIDGVKTMIYQANYAFQAVVVPAGTHRVTLTL